MGVDLKYGQVTTEKGDIPADEPVFLLRAKDANAEATIAFYRSLSQGDSPPAHIVGVDAASRSFESWRLTNGVKTPD